jgi:hypothetical protein
LKIETQDKAVNGLFHGMDLLRKLIKQPCLPHCSLTYGFSDLLADYSLYNTYKKGD